MRNVKQSRQLCKNNINRELTFRSTKKKKLEKKSQLIRLKARKVTKYNKTWNNPSKIILGTTYIRFVKHTTIGFVTIPCISV